MDALRFQQASLLLERRLHSFSSSFTVTPPVRCAPRHDEVTLRINGQPVEFLQRISGNGSNAPSFSTSSPTVQCVSDVFVCRMNFDRVSANTERPRLKSRSLRSYKISTSLVSRSRRGIVCLSIAKQHAVVRLRRTQAVDTETDAMITISRRSKANASPRVSAGRSLR